MPSAPTPPGGDGPPAEEPEELLTVEEAARRFNFSPQNLRRRAAKGGFPGARQVVTERGPQWVIPAGSFTALGYRSVLGGVERGPAGGGHGGPAPGDRGQADELEAGRRQLEEERARLAQERAALDQMAADLEEARQELERERRSLEADRQQLAAPGTTSLRARLARRAAEAAPTPPPRRRRAPAWVPPEDGVCPTTHPVKAKLRSGVYRLPGTAAYERTRPDRCYRDEQAAVNDGLAPPRR